jgi:hypothetical protein
MAYEQFPKVVVSKTRAPRMKKLPNIKSTSLLRRESMLRSKAFGAQTFRKRPKSGSPDCYEPVGYRTERGNEQLEVGPR